MTLSIVMGVSGSAVMSFAISGFSPTLFCSAIAKSSGRSQSVSERKRFSSQLPEPQSAPS